MKISNKSTGNYLTIIAAIFLIIIALASGFNPFIFIIIIPVTVFGIINLTKLNSTIFEIQENGISKIQGKRRTFIAWNEIKSWGRLVSFGSVIGPYDENDSQVYKMFLFVNKAQERPYFNFHISDKQFLIKFDMDSYLKIKEKMDRIGIKEFKYKNNKV